MSHGLEFSITLAAAAAACYTAGLLSPGIPQDILESYPSLKAFRNAVATVPEIAAYYAKATDDVRKNGYTPDH